MHDRKSTMAKTYTSLSFISIAMAMYRCDTGHRFRRQKSSCGGVAKSLFEASIQKSRNGPSTRLIGAASCVERSNAMIKAEELSYLSIAIKR